MERCGPTVDLLWTYCGLTMDLQTGAWLWLTGWLDSPVEAVGKAFYCLCGTLQLVQTLYFCTFFVCPAEGSAVHAPTYGGTGGSLFKVVDNYPNCILAKTTADIPPPLAYGRCFFAHNYKTLKTYTIPWLSILDENRFLWLSERGYACQWSFVHIAPLHGPADRTSHTTGYWLLFNSLYNISRWYIIRWYIS